jgi:hypothetical protein
MGLLTQTAEPARQVLGVETIDVVADRGYFKIEDVEACERVGCIPHVPRPQRGSSVREGFFRKDEFRYDAGRDAYVCPAGTLLTPIRHGLLRDLAKVDYGNRRACRDCPMRARRTNHVRSVSRLENEAVLDRMAERLKKRPEILDRRREVVEHPFGSIKQWMHQGAFLMRGLANVRAEFSLTARAYNLRRALNILGVEAMTASTLPIAASHLFAANYHARRGANMDASSGPRRHRAIPLWAHRRRRLSDYRRALGCAGVAAVGSDRGMGVGAGRRPWPSVV